MFGDDMIFCERQQANKTTRPQDYKTTRLRDNKF